MAGIVVLRILLLQPIANADSNANANAGTDPHGSSNRGALACGAGGSESDQVGFFQGVVYPLRHREGKRE